MSDITLTDGEALAQPLVAFVHDAREAADVRDLLSRLNQQDVPVLSGGIADARQWCELNVPPRILLVDLDDTHWPRWKSCWACVAPPPKWWRQVKRRISACTVHCSRLAWWIIWLSLSPSTCWRQRSPSAKANRPGRNTPAWAEPSQWSAPAAVAAAPTATPRQMDNRTS